MSPQSITQYPRSENRAGLVVLATGLGKTFLAAFDSQPYRRVLFVAHRQEILAQAMKAFRLVRPGDHMGMYHGTEKTPDAQVVFASIQTMGRLPHLRQFAREAFDYVVVDAEFHRFTTPMPPRIASSSSISNRSSCSG